MAETEYDWSKIGNGKFPRVVIAGAGISGLCLAIRLKKAGFHSFVILEKSDEVGGTWFDNRYPGCGCDVPSVLYSFSFALKPDWSRKYPPQSEILDYLRACADRYGIREHIRLGVEVTRATYHEDEANWRVETAKEAGDDGETYVADIFVSAVGQLSRPSLPEIPGRESFAGPAFHTARWDPSFDARDKRLAVVGNGASAIQAIPRLAEVAREVVIYQRTANWVAQRYDYRYPGWLQAAFRWLPGFARLWRWGTYWSHEWRIHLYTRRSWLNKGFSVKLMKQMKAKLPEALHAKVMPQYPAGCKRVLLSNDYLESLSRENVEVVTESIEQIVPEGVVTKSGRRDVDAIVFATGFESNRFLYPMEIRGRDGDDLRELWSVRPTTYLGMLAAGFPNFFMLYGPNTNLGHNSIIFMIECQVNYLVRCLKQMRATDSRTIEVRPEAVEAFDRELQAHLKPKVWNGYVKNWYTTDRGHIVNNWCRSTFAYWRQTRRPVLEDLRFASKSTDRPERAEEISDEPAAAAR
ncbi:MAG: NAD(P)/FAD-dependent oxidoreductase [Planctomycetota bacterium]|nr:MAG: NAD(P)/FAD-dependent oxidoreductase [Planctomycetota bacterium]